MASVLAASSQRNAAASAVRRHAAGAAGPSPANGSVLPAASTAASSRQKIAPQTGQATKAWGPSARSAARLPGEASASQVAHLKEMGFGEDEARQALAECVWDVNKALDLLVTRAAAAAETSTNSKLVGEEVADGADRDRTEEQESAALRTQVAEGSSWASQNKGSVACQEPSAELASSRQQDSENSTTASATSSPRSRMESSTNSPHQITPDRQRDQVSEAEKVEETQETASSSRNLLRRVCQSWSMAEATISVEVNDFVRVWSGSETELGWVYVEDPFDSTRAGWLPHVVLEAETPHQTWMLATKTMEAVHSTQLSSRKGTFLKVYASSKTEDGWTYAEQPGDADTSAEAGWVPTCCLAWEDTEA
eukprot:TRINITY_DN93783_c0_g1_i1.p1 TRINITY_DN93783_c0_g1~~TRINITY_DN93783_c0_g1_i1.p1  ORF type:complete len:367 (+),score=83.55 TRINITY_DN93783_c0_g1_i1:114-1214(+)